MKYIIPTLLFVLLFGGFSTAQETASATTTGTFAVLGYTTFTKLADLNFGNLIIGVNTTVQPTDAQAAEFLFNGDVNTVVQVTITFPSDLTCGSNTMKFHTISPIYNTIPDATTAVQFKHTTGGSASTGADGNLYIWAGGRVMANKGQAAGIYTGTMQVDIVQQ
jgi:hypothetical protein